MGKNCVNECPKAAFPGLTKPVFRIFFGTAITPMILGEDVQDLLDLAYAGGINAFDCARGYGDAEILLGKWMQECRNREGMVILTNWSDERVREANSYAEAHGLAGFSAVSPNYGLARQVADPWGGGCITLSCPENAGSRAWYARTGLPVIAYSSLGRGFFSGKFKSYDYETAKGVLDHAAQKGYLSEDNMERLRRAEILAEQKGCTVSEIAMRYLFSGDRSQAYAAKCEGVLPPFDERRNAVVRFDGMIRSSSAKYKKLSQR